jgi:hypothetical protein
MPGRITFTPGRGRLQAGAIAVGAFWPVIATIFYLMVSALFIIEPRRHLHLPGCRAARPGSGR